MSTPSTSPSETAGPLLSGESLLTLPEVARRFPGSRGNKKTHVSTVFRWVTSGAKAIDGTNVRLEAVRAGSRWLSSVEAVARFVERLSAAPARPANPVATPATRRQASERAGAELERAGI